MDEKTWIRDFYPSFEMIFNPSAIQRTDWLEMGWKFKYMVEQMTHEQLLSKQQEHLCQPEGHFEGFALIRVYNVGKN